jgi:hypothetical protein
MGQLRAIYSKDSEVKLATQSGEGQAWEIETVKALADAGYRINIIQTAYEDRLFAAYHSTSENQFEVLEKVDGEWTSVYLHEGLSEPGPGRNPSLLEQNDTLYAVYYDAEQVYQATLPLGDNSPWPIADCNASLNIHYINTVWEDFTSDIDGSPLASGDWIGLFYQDENGQFICSDAVQIADPADNFSLQACGDDPLTPEKDGFVPGEVFRYKVLKDDVEYQPADLYPEYHELGYFSPSQPNALQAFEGNLRASALKELNTQIWPPLPPDCDNATVLSCGDIYTDHTNSAGLRNAEWYNCTDNVLNGPEVVYVFDQPTAQDVRITMSNLQDDLELFLFDECDQFNCIAKSERSGTGDEVILFQNLAAGTYYVVVEGYYGYESTYDIALECGEFPQGDFTCAPEAISCGETIAGSTNGACDEVDFYNCGEAYTSGPEVVYELTVDELTQMTATLNITGGSDLDLFLLDDFDPNACIAFSNQGGETVEQLLLDLYPGRTYYLVVDGFNGAQGGYELTVSCNDYIPCNNPPCPPPPPGVDCEDLPSIACNETIEGNNANGNNRVETWGSCSGIVTGSEVVYRFTNPQDQYVKIELFDFRENLNVYVLDECPTGGCILAGDKSGLIPEAVQSPVLPAGEYVIAVDGFAGAVSDFKLRVTCENAFVECLEIPIVPGENYISSNRVPVDLEMKKIFNGTGDFVEVVIDENSREMMNTSPGSDPSNDAQWDVTDGYKILADGSGTLTICGEEADSTLAIEVVGVDDDGIPFNNYIPYLYQNELIVSQAFSNTEGLGALFYIPPTGTGTPMPYFFQTGGSEDFSMQGGRGYILQVDADGSFSYRNAGAPYVPNGCTYFQTPVRQTFHHSVVKMPRAVVEEWLAPGDEIGFFTTDGVLTGSARYNGYDCLSVLQADQVGSSPKEGFKIGETIRAKIWKKATNTVVEVMPVFQEKPSTFANGLVYRLQELQLLTTTTDAGQTALNWTLYPNPAKGKAFVEFALRQTSPVSIEILSIDGRRQLVLPPSVMSQGHHTVELDLDGLPSGAYWIRLITQDGATVRKLVIEKQ